MLGTILNAMTVIVCSVLGMFIKGAQKYEKSIVAAMSLGVVFLGTAGVINGLAGTSTLLFMLYLVIGTIIGEFIKIDEGFNRFGQYLGDKFGNGGTFAKGFVTSSLIYCVGAMSVIGAFEGSLSGDHSILFTKSVMDGVMSIILSSIYGIGVLFSGFAVFFYQGTFVMLAQFLSPIITDASVGDLSTVGSVIVAALGLDMLGVVNMKYSNMLPAMFLPVIYHSQTVQNAISMILRVFS